MQGITIPEAVSRLKVGIDRLSVACVREVYNELDPQNPVSMEEVRRDTAGVEKRIADRISRGLLIEEILDLWPVVLTGEGRLWYDDETGLLEFRAPLEPVEFE